MKRLLDLSRPDVLFGICWGSALWLSKALPVAFSVDPDSRVRWLVSLNIASFFIIYWLVRGLVNKKLRGPRVAEIQLGSLDEGILRRFIRLTFVVWSVLYLVTVLYSGGLPIVWLLSGSGKTYTDFGVPTLTGLLNMLRAFMLTASLLLFLKTRRRHYISLPIFLIITCVAEVSRGSLLVLLAHSAGLALLLRPTSVSGLIKLVGYSVLFVLAFGALGEFRGGGIDSEGLSGDQEWFLKLPVGVFFAFVYLVSPLNNLYFAADSIHPTYSPYFTFSTLLPSVLRVILFPNPGEYPIELAAESFNATTFYSPLLADFGWLGAGLLVCVIQFFCSYVHVKARLGSLYYTLVYPALFMSVLLSVFYMYFTSLVTVLFPIVVSIFIRYRGGKLKRMALASMEAPKLQSAE